MSEDLPAYLERADAPTLAYHHKPGTQPGVVFLGGFMSDMTGTKATALEAHCRQAGYTFTRFDYRGHGRSEGRFVEATIGAWVEDATTIFDHLTQGPQILVGSSMGAWIALLATLARPERVVGLIGIAAAPDFTEDLLWAQYSEAIRRQIIEEGEYPAGPYPITWRLIEEGRHHLLLRDSVGIDCPVRLLHGLQDTEVPYTVSLRLLERLRSQDVTLTLIKAGNHRLSEPEDITRLCRTLDELASQAGESE